MLPADITCPDRAVLGTPPAEVAFVIVTWRSDGMTIDTVRAVLDLHPDSTVLVVACGGERDISSTLRHDHRVRVISSPNLGYAGGNNLGMREAVAGGARYVVVLNSDAEPLSDAVPRLRTVLDRDPTIGLAGGTLVETTESGEQSLNAGTSFDWKTGRTSSVTPASDPVDVDFSCGAMLMFRASALESVGYFDSSFFLFYEEIDWCERARSAGFRTVTDPSARICHRSSESVRKAPRAATYFRARNRLIVLRRYATRHGSPVSLVREVVHGGRVVLGHGTRRRWGMIWPFVLGSVEGAMGSLAFSDEPMDAVLRQRWEVLDRPDHVTR
jgi:GT2 family glycosyltransferase